MALTQSEVSSLYVAIFNRASEGAGNEYWQNDQPDMVSTANTMLETSDAKDYFGSSLDTNQAFIEHIYKNTLNKTYDEDKDGIDYWVRELEGGKSRGEVVVALIDALKTYENSDDPKAKEAYDQFMNRVEVSNYTADNFEGKNLPDIMPDYAVKLGFENGDLGVTADHATVVTAEETINGYIVALGDATMLTPDTDILSGTHFIAPMEYVPDGSDRILTLQDEDQLTGTGDNATLDVILGNKNADEGTTGIVTPNLKNIKEINIDWTGNTSTLDLRYTDNALSTINVNKVTSDANTLFDTNGNGVQDQGEYVGVIVNNISSPVSDLTVANTADVNTNVTFTYTRGVLADNNNELNLTLDKIIGHNIVQNSTTGSAEGFETLNIDAKNNVYLNALSVNELQKVNITGSNDLEIVSLTPTSPTNGEPEYNLLGNNSGIMAPNSAGIRSIDASEFKGDLTLDISNAMGRSVDPNDSGKPFYGEVKGGEGNDTFYTSSAIAGNNSIDGAHNTIDGGAGDNTLVSTVGSIANDADISKIQTLELRDQGGMGTVDMDAFDSELTKVFMRDESAGDTTFDLNDVTKPIAENGLVLAHSITTAGSQTVDIELNNAIGDNTVALTVVNDKNQTTTFDYTLDAHGKTANDVVENITIHDNDTETNVVNLTRFQDHTGTITLDGGMAGNDFTIIETLNAKTVDASGQASNLRLTVGDTIAPIAPINQEVKLGTGNDILTFNGINELNDGDVITDAGGEDVVRALFNEDATLNLSGIEALHTAATANITLDMKDADIKTLVLLSDTATDGSSDINNLGANNVRELGNGTPQINNIITLENTNLEQLNFYADADTDDIGGIDDVTMHNFNGVTLANNNVADLTVNINTSLDISNNNTQGYNIGTLTSHGNKSMDIVVGNDNRSTNTVINNIYGKNMETLTAETEGNLNLGTVSGDNAHGSLKLIDMMGVKGNVRANVISLGDNGVVKLADGNHRFSALSSSGKDIVIESGDGDSIIVGSAQDDTITAGDGNNMLHGDRGDNKIFTGSGNDFVTAKDGNDTVDFGSGLGLYIDNLGTGIDASDATNAISLSDGGIVTTIIDVQGDTQIQGGNITYSDIYAGNQVDLSNVTGITQVSDNVNQIVAVGKGSDLTISWTGNQINVDRATLDGGQAIEVTQANTIGGDDNANLAIQTGTGSVTFNGAGGNDVYIVAVDDSNNGVTFNGGDGNDTVVAGMGADDITGGRGSDMIILQNRVSVNVNNNSLLNDLINGNIDRGDLALDNVGDTIHIADGESTATEYDTISGFQASATHEDLLDLATTTIAGNNTYSNSYGSINNAVTVNNGWIVFNVQDTDGNGVINSNDIVDINRDGIIDSKDTQQDINGDGKLDLNDIQQDINGDGVIDSNDIVDINGDGIIDLKDTNFDLIDGNNLSDALAFLAKNVGDIQAGSTVLFNYDADGDGNIDGGDASFIFQDGSIDTVVEILHNPADGGASNGAITLNGLSTVGDNDMIHLI